MPLVLVDWSKPLDGMLATLILPQELRCEGDVVLHASVLLDQVTMSAHRNSIATPIAIALAEVIAVEAVRATLQVPGEGTAIGDTILSPVRVQAYATRLRFRQGTSVNILHPFSDVELLFRAYRQSRESSREGATTPLCWAPLAGRAGDRCSLPERHHGPCQS